MLIDIEGIDGAGKSSVARAVVQQMATSACKTMLFQHKRPVLENPYIAAHLEGLGRILWERDATEPRRLLDNEHWVYLSAAWLQAVEQHALRPALRAYDVVVADSWYPKLLSRFALKDDHIYRLARLCYSSLTMPDCIFLLDVPAEECAHRKTEYGYSECGNFDGLRGINRDNFITYQQKVYRTLMALAEQQGWRLVPCAGRTVDQVASVICAQIRALRRDQADVSAEL